MQLHVHRVDSVFIAHHRASDDQSDVSCATSLLGHSYTRQRPKGDLGVGIGSLGTSELGELEYASWLTILGVAPVVPEILDVSHKTGVTVHHMRHSNGILHYSRSSDNTPRNKFRKGTQRQNNLLFSSGASNKRITKQPD